MTDLQPSMPSSPGSVPPPAPQTAPMVSASAPVVVVTSTDTRPLSITVICWIFAALFVLNITQFILGGSLVLLATRSALIGSVLGLSLVLQGVFLAVIYGYWMMRKWAVYLYTAMFALSVLTSISAPQHLFSIATLVGAAALYFGYAHLAEMS